VVCGDAYFIEGQSNSVCYATTGDMSPWVRSFGNTAVATDAGNIATITSDTVWGIGQCAGYNDPKWFSFAQMHCAVGVWGMQIGRHIVQDHGIPVCIINGAIGGSDISIHLRNMSIGSAYGAVYYRVTKAGLLNSLKAIFWEQGESDWIDAYHAGLYKAGFNSLYAAWKGDYPGLRHVYVFQVRPSSGPPEIVCETQRQTPQGRTDLSIMSTSGVVGYGGLHYGANGYQEFGDRIYRLVSRDFYGSIDTLNIMPPNILNASFTDASHTQLLLQFDGPVIVPAGAGMKSYFALDSIPGLALSAIADTAKHTLTLALGSASNAARVSCLPGGNYPVGGTAAEGPCLSNPRGIGALSFHNFPIAGQTIAVRRPEAGSAGMSANPGPAQSRFAILDNKSLVPGATGYAYDRVIEVYTVRGTLIGRFAAGFTGTLNVDKKDRRPVVVRTR
jgi:hypothetical protein